MESLDSQQKADLRIIYHDLDPRIQLVGVSIERTVARAAGIIMSVDQESADSLFDLGVIGDAGKNIATIRQIVAGFAGIIREPRPQPE